MLKLSPKSLDEQSPIKVDRWIEIGSEELRALDEMPDFTAKCLRLGMSPSSDGKPPFFDVDASGRIWSAQPNERGRFFPFHFEAGNKVFGYRNSKKAAN